jgi:DNA-binding transcriptional LysR family regulator
MADLQSLIIFAKVVEAGSFSEAARRLKVPLSTVSRRVAELENQLDVRLLERSTRSLRLTDVGSELLEHARHTAELSETIDNIVSTKRATISGVLRLSAPPSISDSLLTPIVTAFQTKYPQVRVQILVTERAVDHIAEGVDIVFNVGALKDSALIARPILTYRHRLLASPAYLKKNKPPVEPDDLRQHRLLSFSRWRPDSRWNFLRADGKGRQTLTFFPHLSMNDYTGLAAALVTGVGIGDLPPIVRSDLVSSGQLVEVMSKWRFPVFDLSLVHLGNRHVSQQVRAFKEFALQEAPRLFPKLPK